MSTKAISLEKMEVIKNLYLSGIGEEFIALQLDIEIPVVIKVLKEQGIYSGSGWSSPNRLQAVSKVTFFVYSTIWVNTMLNR